MQDLKDKLARYTTAQRKVANTRRALASACARLETIESHLNAAAAAVVADPVNIAAAETHGKAHNDHRETCDAIDQALAEYVNAQTEALAIWSS